MSSNQHLLLATDNLSLPASDNYLDSRLEFSLRETKQFKSAKRRINDTGSRHIKSI